MKITKIPLPIDLSDGSVAAVADSAGQSDEPEQLDSGCGEDDSSLSRRAPTGAPDQEIIAAADAVAVDLVEMGASARTHVGRLLRPSPTDAVLRRSRCPAVLVPLVGREPS